jgi:hypothetical protein
LHHCECTHIFHCLIYFRMTNRMTININFHTF